MSERMRPALKLPQFLQFQSLVHILVHIQAAVLSQKTPGQDGSGGSCLLIPEQENLLSLKISLVYTEKLSVGGDQWKIPNSLLTKSQKDLICPQHTSPVPFKSIPPAHRASMIWRSRLLFALRPSQVSASL